MTQHSHGKMLAANSILMGNTYFADSVFMKPTSSSCAVLSTRFTSPSYLKHDHDRHGMAGSCSVCKYAQVLPQC